ncbi:iron-containing alcohol dehydrogenase [Phocaeicola paurosaccharolyticus]|uniref:iron-containing alcohol dehydrogenase n=1 Tax=Phocaeicola paurosaccharolyticus TaxID=732242 RepID=UPI00046908A4|nr:iron-containing alcohol dehydrogenase [Phocaeicola paurosaccharolyticus]
MVNFDYYSPTRLIFGKGVVEQLAEVMKPIGKRVLLTYGGGSIKRSGLYDKVKSLLKDFEITELSGIEPNPKYDPSVLDGVRLCKENDIEVILSVGGGSVLDCSKAIAAGAKYDGDPWDLISYKVKAQSALPIVDIMTMAATGSEYDAGGVISRTDTNDKIGYMDELLWPVCSFVDPTYTFTVPPIQTVAGVADAIDHIMEQYFASPANELSDGFCEAGFKTLMKNVHIVLENPEDYEARANISLACAYGCNGIYSLGIASSGWPMHAIEHALSAYYDITHGIGLAIITPRWMKHVLSEKTVPRFAKFGVNVLGIDPSLKPFEIAKKSIDMMFDFYKSIGIPMHLREVGIDETRIKEMAHHVATTQPLDGCWAPLSEDDIAAIMLDSL